VRRDNQILSDYDPCLRPQKAKGLINQTFLTADGQFQTLPEILHFVRAGCNKLEAAKRL
jgi:hypothetical protein